MTPLIEYLSAPHPPVGNSVVDRKLRLQAAHYILIDGILYKRSYTLPYLKCLSPTEAQYVLQEIHEGVCGNHTAGRSLMHKVLTQGYYWPTLAKDARLFLQRCDKCQRFAPIPQQPLEQLTSITSPWPFAQWGIDLIGPFPLARS